MNLEEVARLAGVSRSTVSRVVTEDSRVSDAVRHRVLEIMREHDYHPNAAARRLASRRTRILGLLVPQAVSALFSAPFFSILIQGVASVCKTPQHRLLDTQRILRRSCGCFEPAGRLAQGGDDHALQAVSSGA